MSSVAGHRKRKHSTKSKTRTSRSHRSHREDEVNSTKARADAHPATIEELREARVSYLETPPVERQKKMRYEYTKVVPVKVKSTVSNAGVNKESATRSKARPVTKRASTSGRVESKSTIKDERGDDAQYVYRVQRPATQQRGAAQTGSRDAGEELKPETRHTVPRKTERRTTTRRNTAPVIRNDTESEEQRSRSPRASHPPLERSTTALPAPSRPSIRRSVSSAYPKTEVSTAKSTATNAKRSSIARSSFFGALPPVPEKKVSCLTCGDETSARKTAKLPCTHRMCHSCLERIFKLAINDPAHMPPRCCTERQIDLKHVANVKALQDHDFQKTYNRKLKEFKAKNRIYCPRRGCGEWIQPKHMSIDKGRKVGKCPRCKTQVCGICSQTMHKSKECPKDPVTKAFVETAKKAGWQKCHSCSAMVELKEGCNHMTCRCTAEFCMVCGLKWKSCDCPWFSYDQVGIDGDPIRFQQEMDRRREQEQRDEALARRMETLDVDAGNGFNFFGNGAGAHHMNQNFIQQAREALTANYQQADQAARGLLNGFFTGRDNRLPDGMPGLPDETPQLLRRQTTHRNRNIPADDPAEGPQTTAAGVPVIRRQMGRRRSTLQSLGDGRVLTPTEREQERRIRMWANDLPN